MSFQKSRAVFNSHVWLWLFLHRHHYEHMLNSYTPADKRPDCWGFHLPSSRPHQKCSEQVGAGSVEHVAGAAKFWPGSIRGWAPHDSHLNSILFQHVGATLFSCLWGVDSLENTTAEKAGGPHNSPKPSETCDARSQKESSKKRSQLVMRLEDKPYGQYWWNKYKASQV